MSTSEPAAPRTLAEALRATDDDGLAALLRGRPDLANPVPTDLAQLASRAATRSSVVHALDRVDRWVLDVLEALAVAEALGDGPPTLAGVATLLGTEQQRVRPVLDHLRTLALLWGPDDGLRLVRTVREVLGPHPAGLGAPARQVLLAHSPARLARIAADLGLTPTGDPVADAVAVGASFADGPRLDALLDDVGEQARSALATLADGPPTGRISEARRDIDVAGARSPVDHLLARGLLVPVESGTVLLPGEVGLHLRGGRTVAPRAEPPACRTIPVDLDRVDRTGAGAAAELVREVSSLLESWAQAPPPVLRAGGLGVRDLRRAAAVLDVEESRAALVAELALGAGLVGASSELEDVWLPTPAFDAWSALEPAARWGELAVAWLGSSRVPGLVGRRDDRDRVVAAFGPDLERSAAPDVRRLALGVLAGLPAGASTPVEDVLAVVAWLRPRRAGRLREDLVRWALAEAEALGVTGVGALSTQGRALLDGAADPVVGASADAGRDRAVAALARLLPEPLDHVLLQADLTAVAPGPLEPALERELALLADVESTGAATVYRFSAASLRRGLDAGRTAAELHAFLASVSRTPVPQPLDYLVDDLARRHGLLRVGSASSFLRCDDEAVLTELLADRRTADLALRRLAPTVLSSQSGASAVLDRLRELGYAPAAEAADGSVLLSRTEHRRAPSRPRPAAVAIGRTALSERLVQATVRALRAGDRTASSRPDATQPGPLGRLAPVETMAMLRGALEAGSSVWIGYVDNHGATSERVVDPVRVEGGWLTAYDHRTEEVRSFAVHRISGIARLPMPA